MSETKFPEGLSIFPPHEKAPQFIKAILSVNREKFISYLMSQEPDEKGYIAFEIKESKEGKLYLGLKEKFVKEGSEEIPF